VAPADEKPARRAAGYYARFRASPWFVISLFAIIVGWIGWNIWPGLVHFDDPEFGRLNLFLSTEASLASAVISYALDKQAAAHKRQSEAEQRQLRCMLHLMEAVRDALVARQSAAASGAATGVAAPDEPAGPQ
jgi:uncharacterized membrane protein